MQLTDRSVFCDRIVTLFRLFSSIYIHTSTHQRRFNLCQKSRLFFLIRPIKMLLTCSLYIVVALNAKQIAKTLHIKLNPNPFRFNYQVMRVLRTTIISSPANIKRNKKCNYVLKIGIRIICIVISTILIVNPNFPTLGITSF